MAEAALYRAMPNDARMMRRSNRRSRKWPELYARVHELYLAIYALGHRRIPISTALLQEGAKMFERLPLDHPDIGQQWLGAGPPRKV